MPGVGPVKAAKILAAVELGRRTLARSPAERALLRSPREVAAYLLPRYGAGAVERFGIVMLDTKHRVVRATVLSVGTLDASLVHPREVFRAADRGRRGRAWCCFTTTRRATRRRAWTTWR